MKSCLRLSKPIFALSFIKIIKKYIETLEYKVIMENNGGDIPNN